MAKLAKAKDWVIIPGQGFAKFEVYKVLAMPENEKHYPDQLAGPQFTICQAADLNQNRLQGQQAVQLCGLHRQVKCQGSYQQPVGSSEHVVHGEPAEVAEGYL